MSTLIAAYLFVWLAVAAYVFRLGAGQRRLERTIEALESQLEPSGSPHEERVRAA